MRQSIRRAHQTGASTLLHDCREHAAIIRTIRLHREMYACADAVVVPRVQTPCPPPWPAQAHDADVQPPARAKTPAGQLHGSTIPMRSASTTCRGQHRALQGPDPVLAAHIVEQISTRSLRLRGGGGLAVAR